MSKWMILSKKTGQLGNRLTVYAHCLAAARHCGYRLLNPAFAEYAPYFRGPRAQVAATEEIPSESAAEPAMLTRRIAYLAARVAYKSAKVLKHVSFGRLAVARARNEEHLDLKTVIDAAEIRRCRVLILQGYHFRHHDWYAPHDGFIRDFLAVAEPWRSEGLAAIAALRRRCAVTVGIHIRHGDYRQHLGGRFYWEVPVYVAFMARMRELLAPREVGFLICSNAVLTGTEFAGYTWSPGPGHLASDLLALSSCDWILGPPSSFSSWAAYAGRVPLLRLEEPRHAITLEGFCSLATPDPLY